MSVEVETEETLDEAEEQETVQRVTAVTPIYSYILIGCLIAVFIAQMVIEPKDSLLFDGGKSGSLAGFHKFLFIHGDYWRILTSSALHGGLLHLGFNSYALYVLGRLIETLSNRAHLGVIFLLSVVGGGLLSLTFSPVGIAVGASGGIIGFLGYLTVYGYRRRELLSSKFLKSMLINIGFIAIFGISINIGVIAIFGDQRLRIDNFAHLGGLLAGAIYGFLQIPSDLHQDPRETSKLMETIGIASIGIFAFVSAMTILLLLEIITF